MNEAELPLIAILGPTGAKVFSFTGCMPAPELATALAEFLDANDLESSDAVKLKVFDSRKTTIRGLSGVPSVPECFCVVVNMHLSFCIFGSNDPRFSFLSS